MNSLLIRHGLQTGIATLINYKLLKMKKHLTSTFWLIFLLTNVKAQFCDSNICYSENSCLQDAAINKQDYVFSRVKNIYKSATKIISLYMTVYSPCVLPADINDTTSPIGCNKCKRPFIMLIHGGGFRIGCRTLIDAECMEFAKRGYIVASIDYRLGWVPEDFKGACNNFCFAGGRCGIILTQPCRKSYSDSLNFAVYRSIQDADAALRFIKHYASNLHIDTSYLYIGGYSAGSITAMSLCYMNQADMDLAMPKAKNKLGLYNTYGNSFTEKYKLAGFFNNWGGIKDTNFINALSDKIPMIAFHGIDDPIVPFEKDYPYNCSNGAYGYFFGSKLIYTRLVNKYPDLPVELYACYGKHGIFDDDPESDPKSLYRIQKAVCFFNRIRKGDKSQKIVLINKNDDDISYAELNSTSPVDCDYTNFKKEIIALADK